MTIIQGDFGRAKAPKKKEAEEKKPAPIYQFHISLSFSEPLIWRRIRVPGEMTLQQFHRVLQVCMGWSGEHNHQFYVGKVFYNRGHSGDQKKSYNEADYDLHSLEEAMKWCFTYIYDAGDGWEHEIVVEETLPAESGQKLPEVIDGEWACPPEEIGNVHNYEEYIYAWENPDSDKNQRILSQYALSDFDPYAFDSHQLNEQLKKNEF